jgi:GWxTD domain-containing protein
MAVAILFLASTFSLLAQKAAVGLPEKYRIWLEEEVVYIITPTERQVFRDLTSDRERDFFIEAFWKHRDPTPGTDKNEFREEHNRRIAHANRYFRGTGRPGWKSDRGKVYIILGEPRTTRPYTGTDAVYPAEVWSYQGVVAPGLPSEFDLIFFQKGRIGDYVLYDPAGDGPWSLMTNYRGTLGDYLEAYETLSIIEPDLARLSISLIPGESVRSFPSLMSMALLQNIDSAAYRSVEDLWAKKFKEYKSLVEVEYSANYMESGSVLQVLLDPSGIPFVHFSLQPRNISLAGEGSGVSTDLTFNGILTDLQGKTVYQFDKKVPLRFTKDQYEKLRHRPFSFTDLFPILPGEYKISVLMKNSVSKEFTTLEGTVRFPTAFPAPRLSPLLLSFNATRLAFPADAGGLAKTPAQAPAPRPFVVRDMQLYSDPELTFVVGDTLHVSTQVLGPALKDKSSLKFLIEKDGVEREAKVLPLAGNPDALNFFESFPLAKVPPGYYRAVVLLLDENGRLLDRQARDFQIATADSMPRPWAYALSQIDQGGRARIDYILGRQCLNLGDFGAALSWLEKAHQAAPENRDFALALGRALFALGRMDDALAVLQPLAARIKEDSDLALQLGRIYQALGQFGEAVAIYRDALTSFGLQTQTLNDMGECYARLGEKAEALAAWKKSLELDPNQALLREKIASLEKKSPAPGSDSGR